MIIVLNGPINSGKTTIAKILRERIPDTAHIEVDKIREFIDWMENEPAWEMSFDIALQVAKEFIERDLNIIITYHISDKGFKQLERELKPLDPNIFAFTLKPSLEKVMKNRGTRDIDERDKTYIKDSFERKLHEVSYGEIIDNSAQTSTQTAEYILNKVQKFVAKQLKYPRRDKKLYTT